LYVGNLDYCELILTLRICVGVEMCKYKLTWPVRVD
jgi:hypothetical protein